MNCTKGEAIDIGKFVFTTVINSLSYTFFSIDFARYSPGVGGGSENFKILIEAISDESRKTNISDVFPLNCLFDPQGIRRRGKDHLKSLFKVFNDIIDERLQLRASEMDKEAYCDVLDSFISEVNNSAALSRHDILHLFFDLFVADTDTTAVVVKWAMAELLHNPEKMAKAKEELLQILGKDGKSEESDISKFCYLNAIVKETLRLHPPFPFVHRKSKSEAEIGGFRVPKHTLVLINLWAIGRNSSTWSDLNSFIPERFLDSKIDINGHDFGLIPFGSGRRMYPGLPLVHRSVHLILASLLHCFDWEISDAKKHQELDMSEKHGVTLHRDQPLLLLPIKRG